MASGYIEARRSLFLFDFVKLALSGASLSDLGFFVFSSFVLLAITIFPLALCLLVVAVTFGSSDAQTGKRAAILLIIDTINGIISFLKEGLLCQAGENFVKALRVKVAPSALLFPDQSKRLSHLHKIFSALLRQEIRFYDQNSFDDLKVSLLRR